MAEKQVLRNNRPQDIEDQQDQSLRYDNDVGQKWTRGYGSPYPDGNFDRGNAWRQKDGSIHSPATNPEDKPLHLHPPHKPLKAD